MSSVKHYIVVGLGITGLSVVRYLKAQGAAITVMDTRETLPQLAEFQAKNPDVKVHLGKLDESKLKAADVIVLSPGVALSEPAIAAAVDAGVSVIGDVELFAQASKAPVIGITGTNAKSTVTTLVGLMAEAQGLNVQVGGNLGIPVLDLLAANPHADLFVLELSSFQLETTHTLKPSVATVLNISPDHMDRYATTADYQRAKHRIYQGAQVAVCNRDDALTDTDTANRKIYFTLNKPKQGEFGLVENANGTYLAFGDELLIATKELPVIGKHYQANALASLAMGYAHGFKMEPMLDVLRRFKGLPHRCQFVTERNHVKWYNDSKGTNVGATIAAIEGLGSDIAGKIILIAGGIGKNADFSSMAPVVKKYVRHVVLIGRDAPVIAAAIDGAAPMSSVTSMQEAVRVAAKFAEPNDAVLLSPACASFDMFKHFEHRGDVFMQEVERLEIAAQ